ncbi:hypothetical protein RUND412_006280 [Rhizina undulata]
MNGPASEQHSFFRPPVISRKPNPNPLKRPHDHSPPASPNEWPTTGPPSSPPLPDSDHDDPPATFHVQPLSRRGRHLKRFETLLSTHHLPAAPKKPFSLRAKHQAVLSTILYKSLLTSDFDRASRAFGLLLRGKDMDLRGVWEIGLEILLKRDREEGRDKAVEFLKRMVLFFPYRPRLHSHHPSVHTGREKEKEKEKRKTKEKERKRARPPPAPSALEFQTTLFELLTALSGYEVGGVSGLGEAGRRDEMHPENIREEIEGIMLTPPWSDMVELWALRGMICEWLADLESAEGDRENGGGEGDDEEEEGSGSKVDAVREERVRNLRREARTCWEAVWERGGVVPEGLNLEEEGGRVVS